jgi:hypothetical protein
MTSSALGEGHRGTPTDFHRIVNTITALTFYKKGW